MKARIIKITRIILWPKYKKGLPSIISDNLPKANKLPVKVTPPIKTVKNTADKAIALNTDVIFKNSADPTSKLAIPPKPLNKATSSGIVVIFTNEAAEAPTIAPAINAIESH